MTADEIRSLRRELGLTQRQLAEALGLEVELVRQWERDERFPTRAHCEAMATLRERPPARGASRAKAATPFEVLADPAFYTLLRKLLAHPKLRADAERLAEPYPDPH